MGMAIRNDLLAFTTKAGSQGALQAVDRASGEQVWLVEFGGDATVFGPAATGDLFVVSVWEGDDGTAMVALDAESGEEVWRVEFDSYPTAPTYMDSVVYVATTGGLDADSAMVALDAETGEELWRYDAPEALDLGERVAVADGVVVAAAWSLEENGIGAYGFDTETGDVLWTFTESDEITFDPVVADGIVLITDLPSTWGLDLATGEVLWSQNVGGIGGGAALADGIAYYGLEDEVRAFDASTGAEVWTSPVTRIAGAPIVADGIVYTAVWRPSDEVDPHYLHALDASSGDEVWQLPLDSQVNGNQPLAVDGVLYVDADSGVIAFGGEGGPVADTPAAVAGGTYQSEEFAYTIEWDAPWSQDAGESSVDDGQDFTTLQMGPASLAIRTASMDLNAEEIIDAMVAERESGIDDLEVLASDGDRDFASATLSYTVGRVTTIEYMEVTVVSDGTIRLVTLDAPAERFPFYFASASSTITLDGDPVFTAEPQE
jgi:outer membrane protein assembly factor BamB